MGTTCKNLKLEYQKNILWNPLLKKDFLGKNVILQVPQPSMRIWEDFHSNNLNNEIINYNNSIINNDNNNHNNSNYNNNNNDNTNNKNLLINTQLNNNNNNNTMYKEYKEKHIKKTLYEARILSIEKRRDWERNSRVSNQFSEQPSMFFLGGPDAEPR